MNSNQIKNTDNSSTDGGDKKSAAPETGKPSNNQTESSSQGDSTTKRTPSGSHSRTGGRQINPGSGNYSGNNRNSNSTGGYSRPSGTGGYSRPGGNNNTTGGGYSRPGGNTTGGGYSRPSGTGGYSRPGGNNNTTGGGYSRPGGNTTGGGYSRPAGTGGYSRPGGNNNTTGGGYSRPGGNTTGGGYSRPSGTGGYSRPGGNTTGGGYSRPGGNTTGGGYSRPAGTGGYSRPGGYSKPGDNSNVPAGGNTSPGGYKKRTFGNNSGGQYRGRGGSYNDRKKNEYAYQKIVFAKKISKTVKGGKNLSFYTIAIVGDQAGSIGMSSGKARTIANSIEKALSNAQSKIIKVKKIINMNHKDFSTMVVIRNSNRDIMKTSFHLSEVFIALGIENISCKIIGSRNVMNVLFCMFSALKAMNHICTIRDMRAHQEDLALKSS